MATTSAKEWKKDKLGQELEVPSGNTCLVRRVGLDSFVRKGLIPNSLMPMVQEAMKGKKPNLEEMEVSDDTLESILELVDGIVVDVVVEPPVAPVPADGSRDEETLYVDEVDLEDKMFIFNWTVGGSSDLQRFREEQAALVGDLSASEDVERSAEQSPVDSGRL